MRFGNNTLMSWSNTAVFNLLRLVDHLQMLSLGHGPPVKSVPCTIVPLVVRGPQIESCCSNTLPAYQTLFESFIVPYWTKLVEIQSKKHNFWHGYDKAITM